MRGVRTTMQGLIAKNFTTVKVPVKSWGGGEALEGRYRKAWDTLDVRPEHTFNRHLNYSILKHGD